MFYIYFLIFVSHYVVAEFEFPKELFPPEEFFSRIGGFTPLLGYKNAPENVIMSAVRKYINTGHDKNSIELRSSPMTLQCFPTFGHKNFCGVNALNALSNLNMSKCENTNDTFMSLLTPDPMTGNCIHSNVSNIDLNQNSTRACHIPCTPTPFNAYLNSTPIFCNCGQCVELIRPVEIKNENTTASTVTGITITVLKDKERIIRASATFSYGSTIKCVSTVSIVLKIIQHDYRQRLRRFDLQRGRFHCPSEVTCPWEVSYVFTISDPLFRPSYLIVAFVALLSLIMAYNDRCVNFYLNKF